MKCVGLAHDFLLQMKRTKNSFRFGFLLNLNNFLKKSINLEQKYFKKIEDPLLNKIENICRLCHSEIF